MPLIPSDQNLFVVDLHYIASFDEIEPELDAHVAFLEDNYAKGRFIASGPKVPRTGGVIIATAPTRDELEEALKADPFMQKNLARYTVTEFRPSMQAELLKA
ncbi:YciI family protein [Planktotalea sp.]|uniref:YciI family protein n=1 Tax=Planktotalea sp. TaxID=2029877 RepID=UPI0032969AB2